MRLFAPRSYHHHSSIASAASLLLFPSLVSAFVARPTTPTKMMPSSPASVRRSLTTMSMRGVKIEDVLKNPKWPEEPFFRPTDFDRQDESSDSRYIYIYICVCRRACVCGGVVSLCVYVDDRQIQIHPKTKNKIK